MELLGFLDEKMILPELKAGTKDEVLAELVQALVDNEQIDAARYQDVLDAILAREDLGSTGIGNGIAIPHVKQTEHVDDVVGVFGRSEYGIDFDSVDGEPVYLFFLMLSPADSKQHLQILRQLAKVGRNGHLCRLLMEADDQEELADLLAELGEE